MDIATNTLKSIEIKDLKKTYRGNPNPALDSVSLNVESGKVVALIGPNGAGKTTLMGCLLGLLRPDLGKILIEAMSPDDMRVKKQIGYLPERLTFNRWMSGLRFMRDQCALAGIPKVERDKQISALLESVGLEKQHWSRAIKKYSYGMLRRLGLAQALIGNPKFLLLDEPVSGLDPGGVVTFRNIFFDVKKRGGIVIFTSHQLDQVVKVSDEILFIKSGHINEVKTRDVDRIEHLFLEAEGK